MMSRCTLLAVSLFVACLTGPSVLADNKEKAVHSHRLFYTPLERAQLTTEPYSPSAEDTNHSAEEGSAAGKVPESELTDSLRGQIESSELQTAHPGHVIYTAHVSTAEGVYILLNGLPCYRLNERSHGMSDRTAVRLSCPHIDDDRYQIDYLASVKKIDVYCDGKSLGQLSVGEFL